MTCFVSDRTLHPTSFSPVWCCRIEVNFGRREPWFPPPMPGFVFIDNMPVQSRVRGMLSPPRKVDCEVIIPSSFLLWSAVTHFVGLTHAWWQRGVVIMALGVSAKLSLNRAWLVLGWVTRVNEVTLRRARLILEWVTIFGQSNHLIMQPANQIKSVSYLQWDGKWILAKVWWCCVAGELRQDGSFHVWINVTVGGR